MRTRNLILTISLLIFATTSGCDKDGEEPPKASPSTVSQQENSTSETNTETPTADIQGACKADKDCGASEKCSIRVMKDSQSAADCGPDQTYSGEKKACVRKECSTLCTQTTGRYRFNDRRLLQNDIVPGGVDPWVWGSVCSVKGLCKAEKEQCVAASETDCRAALICSWFGQCSLENGACVSKEAADCQASTVCKEHGRCTPADGICTATKEADCRASTMCEKLNYCAVNDKGLCRVPEGETTNFKSMHGSSSLPKKELEAIEPVEKAPGGKTVAELFAEMDTLQNTEVTVRGKVVKFTPNILGRNWIHVQDGSGDEAKKTHDITITSEEKTTIGSIVTFKGTLVKDQNFGSGYFYPVLLEKATIVP